MVGVLAYLLDTLLEELLGLLGFELWHRRPLGLSEGLAARSGYPVRHEPNRRLGTVLEDLLRQGLLVEAHLEGTADFSFWKIGSSLLKTR